MKIDMKIEKLISVLLTVVLLTLVGCGEESTGGAADSDTNSDMVDTNSDTVDTDSDTVDTNSDTVDTDSDTVNTDSDTVDTSSDTVDTDTALPTDCTGLNDFTGCSVITAPDRAYDICISGVCRSPGCGTSDCNPPGPHFSMADTSARLCYNALTTVTCASPGEALYGQDAQFGWDVTHAAVERFTRNTAVADEPTVVDNVTDLIWQGCAYGLKGDSCTENTAETPLWEDALASCDRLDWGGFSDWRLPDLFELDSLVDLSRISPCIDITAFPQTPPAEFWSSATGAGNPTNVWAVYFNYGRNDFQNKSTGNHFRCVRGVPAPHPERFSSSTTTPGQPVVTDERTSLEWQGCMAGLSGDTCASGTISTMNWVSALAYCDTLPWGGFSDWRLPSRTELRSIADNNLVLPSIDVTAFPGVPNVSYLWSSSSHAYYESYGWRVSFASGYIDYEVKTSNLSVRCVRGGE